MNLAPMRYKDYVWPHNPETYTISFKRQVAVAKVPFGRYGMQDLGMSYRVMEGEGVFAGKGAYGEFKKLATVFYQGGAGLLVHPVWQAASAYFVSLELKEEPLPDYVRYAFVFWEDGSAPPGLTAISRGDKETASTASGTAEKGNVYIVKKGDTLWSISRRYGVSLQSLIRGNPGIKNPNLIYPGNKVVIP